MGRVECPDCGFVHECGSRKSSSSEGEKKAEKSSSVARGNSIYYVPCKWGVVTQTGKMRHQESRKE